MDMTFVWMCFKQIPKQNQSDHLPSCKQAYSLLGSKNQMSVHHKVS